MVLYCSSTSCLHTGRCSNVAGSHESVEKRQGGIEPAWLFHASVAADADRLQAPTVIGPYAAAADVTSIITAAGVARGIPVAVSAATASIILRNIFQTPAIQRSSLTTTRHLGNRCYRLPRFNVQAQPGLATAPAAGLRNHPEARANRGGDTVKNARWSTCSGDGCDPLYPTTARGRLAAGAIGKLDRAQHENQRRYSRTHG